MNARANGDSQPMEVKPDMITKYVGGIAYAVILTVLLWIGSTVQRLSERMVAVEVNQQSVLKRLDKIENKLEGNGGVVVTPPR